MQLLVCAGSQIKLMHSSLRDPLPVSGYASLFRCNSVCPVQALTESDYGLVKLARREYEPALAEDEMLLKLLDEIEQVHFGVHPAGGGLGDMLASMFSS